jgi:hypothetical protein
MPIHRIHRTPSPYNASELAEIDFEQTADVLYLAHHNHPPGKLVRSGHYVWAFSDVTFQPTIADPTGISGSATVPNTDSANSGNAYFPQSATYVVTAYNEETGQESRASSSVSMSNDLALKRNYNTINWGAVAGATEYRVYKAENSQLYGFIGRTTALTFRDDNIGPDLSEGPPIADNPFVGAGNYPATITFHEQRAFWGRTTNRPNGIWASRSADYENMDFSRPLREDDAFAIGLVANKVNAVNQLVSNKQGLLALTSHNIFSIQGSNEDYITANPPPRVRPEISRGVSRLNPIIIDNVTFYETAKTGEVRTIGYEFELDGIRTDDLTIFSRHLFENQDIISWAYAEKPASCLWLIRGDGGLLCLTWDQAQQVWGWTVCETDGLFKDVCVVSEQGEDRAYFLVEREINGEARLYVERMASELWEEQSLATYLDCSRTFQNTSPVSTVDRLDHLEGMIVMAWVDGEAIAFNGHDPLVVTNGVISLPTPGLVITVGLPFTSLIETLPLAMQTGTGWNVARPQTAGKVVLRVVKTRNVAAGPNTTDEAGDYTQLFDVKQREWEAYGDPIDLLTGDMHVDMAGSTGNETVVVVRSDDPTPMHIAAILVEPDVQVEN